MHKYLACSYCPREIMKVEIDKETDHYIWVRGRRSAKRSEGDNYFDSWSEARDFLLTITEKKVDGLSFRLASAQKTLEEIRNLKPPTA